MAQAQILLHQATGLRRVKPRFLAVKGITRTMKSINRAKNPKLQPTKSQVFIIVAPHMATDIMTPPGVADIGSCTGKIGLKG